MVLYAQSTTAVISGRKRETETEREREREREKLTETERQREKAEHEREREVEKWESEREIAPSFHHVPAVSTWFPNRGGCLCDHLSGCIKA